MNKLCAKSAGGRDRTMTEGKQVKQMYCNIVGNGERVAK
jgi:hypothetical protein